MSSTMNSNYLFIPWLRRGIGTHISRVDDGTDTAGTGRATFVVGVELNDGGEVAGGADRSTTAIELSLYGPGDISAFDTRAIVRTWPAPDVFEAETNYFPLIEFGPADLPWRYTPASASSADRLRPWLCLIALKDDGTEYTYTPPARSDGRLAQVTVIDPSKLPDLKQSWAFCHTQVLNVGASAATTGDGRSPGAALVAALDDPSRAVSRLLCPRRLEPKTAYTCFLVPAFMRGRLAGLGLPLGAAPDGMTPAWDPARSPANHTLPVYYQWRFQTGGEGDFESLVMRLAAWPPDGQFPDGFGQRALDISAFAPSWGASAPRPPLNPLPLASAIRRPGADPTDWTTLASDALKRAAGSPYRAGFEAWVRGLAGRLNDPALQIAGTSTTAVNDARVAPPLYGRWHRAASLQSLSATLSAAPDWFNELNSDPRMRVAAGLGTQVVQRNREQLLAGAWSAVEQLRKVNEQLRYAQLSRELSMKLYARMFPMATAALAPASPGGPAEVRPPAGDAGRAAPGAPARRARTPEPSRPAASEPTPADTVEARFAALPEPRAPLGGGELHPAALDHVLGLTARAVPLDLEGSRLSASLMSPTFRRLARLNGPVAGRQERHLETPEQRMERQVLARFNTGSLSVAPPLRARNGLPAVEPGAAAPVSAEARPTASSEASLLPPTSMPQAATLPLFYGYFLDWRNFNFGVTMYYLLNGRLTVRWQDSTDLRQPWNPYVVGPRTIENPDGDAYGDRNHKAPVHDTFAWTEDLAGVSKGTSHWAKGWTDATPPVANAWTLRSTPLPAAGAKDTAEAMGAAGFRAAIVAMMKDINETFNSVAPAEEKKAFDLSKAVAAARAELDPMVTIERATAERLRFDASRVTVTQSTTADVLNPVTAAPEFEFPMYEALGDLSADWLFSGADRVPPNSIALLESNPRFIEAFMVGLSYQMARMLLFNEFPTDRRATFFRYFWDKLSADSPSPDILPIHTWTRPLGQNGGARPGAGTLLLMIRGDLLHRYPHTVIYAVPARWSGSAHVFDDKASETYPIFRATLKPDATFLGFPFDQEKALGVKSPPADDRDGSRGSAGYFFVIQQQHTAPQFGLEPYTGPRLTADTVDRDALEWGHFVAREADLAGLNYIDLDKALPKVGVRDGTSVKVPPDVKWPQKDGIRSNDVAWLAWRRPYRIAIHASRLLPPSTKP
ncbi:hypothetical protein [Sorangium sp. So ce124]|uniref:hypothetical protein n=1 Tax=Sorangium sp. So ce124 TaxID=3133280 RepID=UPI003F5F62AF